MTTGMTPHELHMARDVLGYYNLPGGYSPGSFTSSLLKTLEVADVTNRERILREFTEFRPAIRIMTTQGGQALVDAVKEASR